MWKRKFWYFGAIPLAAIILTGAWSFAQLPVPPDFILTQSKGMGDVTFSHKTHSAKKPECTACHTNVFQMKRGATTGGKPMTMAAMNEGKLCGACHDGKTAFSVKSPTDCMKCHVMKK